MKEKNEYITLKELAGELNLDRSHLRRYVLKHGFKPVQIRTQQSRNQLTLAVSSVDAEKIRELRRSQGFSKSPMPVQNSEGYFYIVQLVPDLNPNRIKLGFAVDVQDRLDTFRTSAPTAKLLRCWSCKRSWELAAIDSITRDGCTPLGNEVFECENLADVIKRAEDFFAIMPSITT